MGPKWQSSSNFLLNVVSSEFDWIKDPVIWVKLQHIETFVYRAYYCKSISNQQMHKIILTKTLVHLLV